MNFLYKLAANDVNPTLNLPHLTHPLLVPVISLIAGIIILIFPRVLNYIVALYLILIGILGLFGHFKG